MLYIFTLLFVNNPHIAFEEKEQSQFLHQISYHFHQHIKNIFQLLQLVFSNDFLIVFPIKRVFYYCAVL